MTPDAPRRSRMKRFIIALGIAFVLLGFAAYVAAGPYLVLYKLRSGVEARDAEALAECVDFPALRQNLKDQLQVALSKRIDSQQNPLAAFAASLAVSVADPLVNRLISPEGLAELMAGQKPPLASSDPPSPATPAKKPLEDATFGYESFDEFVVSVPSSGGAIRFVLTRSGLSWKLSRIEIPTGH
jgi:hypothetical protein